MPVVAQCDECNIASRMRVHVSHPVAKFKLPHGWHVRYPDGVRAMAFCSDYCVGRWDDKQKRAMDILLGPNPGRDRDLDDDLADLETSS